MAYIDNVHVGQRLTYKEIEVLSRRMNGESREQIAQELKVSANTINTHLRKIFKKLGADGSAHAVAIGLATGILDEKHVKMDAPELLSRRSYNLSTRVGFATFEVDTHEHGILREWQMAPFDQWMRISGWLTFYSTAVDQFTGRKKLTRIDMPGRDCISGHVVELTYRRCGSEYGTGVHAMITWPLRTSWDDEDRKREAKK